MIRLWVMLLFFPLLWSNCIKAPEYPNEPVIEMLGVSRDSMVQSQFNTDSVLIFIGFTDGDGDLGSKDSLNLFVTDLRDGFLSDQFRIPFVPEIGSNNGISGEITITLYTTCCTYPNGLPPCEKSTAFPTNKLSYEIYIKDRSGNMSNKVTTPPIILKCN